jgi:YesN/AraC family two-component response regulator
MIRLLLVDDQGLVCQGLKAILTQEEDFQVVGTAENGEVAIEQGRCCINKGCGGIGSW